MTVSLTIDGQGVSVPKGATILEAAQVLGIDIPTQCWAPNLTPVNACRVCVVEVAGSRVLVPACAREAEPGMVVQTDSPRVRTSRKVVLELLASSVDTSTAPSLQAQLARYDGDPGRFPEARTQAQPVKIDNSLYIRDYAKCITCFKCVEACGDDAQNTFAIAMAGRGFDAHVSTEFDAPLPDSACVYCGNCINVCPTGALMFKSEFDLRAADQWVPERQATTQTVCPYCGVGCVLELTTQDNRIVRVMSPADSAVTNGNLCIKGRFGWEYVQGPPQKG